MGSKLRGGSSTFRQAPWRRVAAVDLGGLGLFRVSGLVFRF